ncbi:MAG: V4R domain-containing protein [Variovorax sp.]
MTAAVLKLHERLFFDLSAGQVMDGERRYVLMRADVLMGAFDQLEESARAEALRALGHSVYRQGADSVRAYVRELGSEALLRAMENGSASLGWGRWTLTAEPGLLRLRVDNSPFARSTRRHMIPACHAIGGMLSAVATTLWSEPAEAHETQCACMTNHAHLTCLFEARRTTA